MTTATFTKPSELRTRAGSRRGARRQHRTRSGGELTFEGKLSKTWEGLLATGAAQCPVCAGIMSRADQAGVCGGCGSELS
ncbi:MAG: hypothetical protein QOG62_1384 [Thermoleophilaceae bacterium]|jgi:hypothetical protein|nr:hypothetical protein [Thermoleophilaceae bacterium]